LFRAKVESAERSTDRPEEIAAHDYGGLSKHLITDCHIHIQPLDMFHAGALELMKKKRPNFDQIAEFCRSPKSFLKYLDQAGVDRAVLINYVAPEVIGFTVESISSSRITPEKILSG
jgi:hypothetical protein